MLAVQRADTALDQARVALERLPERQRHREAAEHLAHLRARRDDIRREQSVQESQLAEIEAAVAGIDAQRIRLDKQMKTIISPREAEALQHELEVLAVQKSDLDDRGLLLLESSSEADRDIERLTVEEAEAVVDEAEARRNLERAVETAQTKLDALRVERQQLADALDPKDLADYERLRATHGGVAITVIEHGMCAGCNMDLSVAELDAIKRRPADEIPECPNCNRLLAR